MTQFKMSHIKRWYAKICFKSKKKKIRIRKLISHMKSSRNMELKHFRMRNTIFICEMTWNFCKGWKE